MVASLLAAPVGEPRSSEQVAARAADACERLAAHLARVVGEIGVRALLKRSLVVASVQVGWLASSSSSRDPQHEDEGYARLRAAMATQPPEVACEGFIAVLSTFVGILERLIGESLVGLMLHEAWPAAFGIEKEHS